MRARTLLATRDVLHFPVMTATRSEPLSIESLLQKQKADKDAAAKVVPSILPETMTSQPTSCQPKFLSKEERAKIAIAERAKEIREQKEKEENSKRDREALERDAEELRHKERGQTRSGSGRCQFRILPLFNN